MSTVSDSYRLQCRNGTWYYHRRTPDHLVEALGKRVIKVSLGTKNKAEAKKLRPLRDLEWDARLAALEQKGTPPTAHSGHSPISLEELVWDYVRKMDKKAEIRLLENPPENAQERLDAKTNIEIELQILDNPSDPRAEEWISRTWDALLSEASVQFEPIGIARDQFHSLVRRALLELWRRKLARTSDQFERSHFDDIFDPSRQKQMAFGELADDYLAWEMQSGMRKRLDQKTLDKLVTNVTLVRDIVGSTMRVGGINHDTCERFLSLLAATPANRTKLYPKLSLEQSVTRAKTDKKPTLSYKSQSQYLFVFKGILDRALKK